MIDAGLPDPEPGDAAPDENAVDAATIEGVRNQRRKVKRTVDRSKRFWCGVLADEIGRAEVHALLLEGGVFAAPFQVGPGGFPQPDATWFAAGKQALVLGLYHRLLAYDLEGVRLMLIEGDSMFREMAESDA